MRLIKPRVRFLVVNSSLAPVNLGIGVNGITDVRIVKPSKARHQDFVFAAHMRRRG